MTELMIVSIDSRYAIICMADHVSTENMWDSVVGHVDIKKNKKLCDVELNGEHLGRVKYFADAIPMLENKVGIKCQYKIARLM